MRNSLSRVSHTCMFLITLALPTWAIQGQVTLGADIVSRYVWRGLDFGDSPSIQPYLEYSAGAITVGTWGAYPFANGAGVNEHDLYASWAVGPLLLGVTDYFFPDGGDYFDYQVDGNHIIEPYLSYTGSFSVLVAVNALNDPDNSVYFEFGFDKAWDSTELSFFLGGTIGKTDFYGADGAALLSVGVIATQAIPLTGQAGRPFSVSYIINPNAGQTFLLLSLGL